jgi:hypothetical protein
VTLCTIEVSLSTSYWFPKSLFFYHPYKNTKNKLRKNYNFYYSFMGVKFATHMKQRTQIAFKNGVLRRMFGGKASVQTLAKYVAT